MPTISFSDDDLLRSKIVDPAWYVLLIKSVGEAPAKDGNSTNYPVESVVVRNADTGGEDFKGVPVEWNFNSKFKSAMSGFLASFGVDVKSNTRYELKVAEGKMIEVFVENDTWNGRILNRVNHKYRAFSQPE